MIRGYSRALVDIHRGGWPSSFCNKIVMARAEAGEWFRARVTRGLDHASRIYPTCALKCPKSGKPDFGWSIFFERRFREEDGLPGHKPVYARFQRAMPGNDGCAVEAGR